MKEIVILEGFSGMLRGRLTWDAQAHEIKLPLPRPIGMSMFDPDTFPMTEPSFQVGVFEYEGHHDDEGMRIFRLKKVE